MRANHDKQAASLGTVNPQVQEQVKQFSLRDVVKNAHAYEDQVAVMHPAGELQMQVSTLGIHHSYSDTCLYVNMPLRTPAYMHHSSQLTTEPESIGLVAALMLCMLF